MEQQNSVRYIFDRNAGLEVVISQGGRAAFAPHTHISTVSVIQALGGTLEITTNSEKMLLSAGSTVVVQPHALHCIITHADYSMATLCFDAEMYAPAPHQKKFESITHFLERLVALGVLHSGENQHFLDSLGRTDIFCEDINDAISQLRKDLEAHPEQTVTLDEMAETVHLDKGHLIRCFKKRFGLTPHGFLTQCRVRKARRDFMGNTSLTQAAHLAGFYDQSHFIRNFKKLHRITPRDYLSACCPIVS